MKRSLWLALCAILIIAGAPLFVYAQGLTGQISGTVQDPSGNVVPRATVELANTGTAQTREVTTDDVGNFVFTQLLPGTYKLKVSAAGFKSYEQQDIVLTATERVVLRQIQLQLGEVTQTVTVQAEAARLQTQSAERAGLISTSQIKELSLKGRDYMGLIRLLPRRGGHQ